MPGRERPILSRGENERGIVQLRGRYLDAAEKPARYSDDNIPLCHYSVCCDLCKLPS